MPLPPDQDKGTDAESLVHPITMPVPEQVVEDEEPPELGDELDDGDATATAVELDGDATTTGFELDDEGVTATLTELDDGEAGFTTILFATTTASGDDGATVDAAGGAGNALP